MYAYYSYMCVCVYVRIHTASVHECVNVSVTRQQANMNSHARSHHITKLPTTSAANGTNGTLAQTVRAHAIDVSVRASECNMYASVLNVNVPCVRSMYLLC